MLSTTLNRIANWSVRHDRKVAVAGLALQMISTAHYARFIDLPDIPYLSHQSIFWIVSGWNAIWWGYIYGALQKRRTAMLEGPAPELTSADD